MTWATTDEVFEITGVTVDRPQLEQAESVVSLFSGRTPETLDRIAPRDQYWLKQAVVWQAAWQASQVAFAQRSAAESVSQDGVTVNYGTEWQLILQPLAARALKNLSWKRGRTSGGRRTVRPTDFTLESSDPYHVWGR